jgi:hypothetical protein
VPATAPEWILGKNSIKVNELITWLQENKHLANQAGYINTITKKSKATGKRYIEVDTWKPQSEQVTEKVIQIQEPVIVPEQHTGEIDPANIPF